jgi:Tol biopolymer transport system component
MSFPSWARDEPERLLYSSNLTGTWELYAWERRTDTRRRVTDRPEGTQNGALDPEGRNIWWFDDRRGDEFGHWVVEPFADGADQEAPLAAPDLPAAYSAGLSLAHGFALIGSSGEGGSAIHLVRPEEPSRLLYSHRENASVGGLSRDERLLCVSHSEHGDSTHPALRVLDLEGATLADLWDGPGLGLRPAGWSPVAGDGRLLVMHERRDTHRPLIWSPATGEQVEPAIELPGEVFASWYPDASALLIVHDHRGRSELYRLDLVSHALTRIPTEPGTISAARVRPDGEIWYQWSSSATPPEIRTVTPAGTTSLPPVGEPAPGGAPYSANDADGIPIFIA